jgi:hypothetical protein
MDEKMIQCVYKFLHFRNNVAKLHLRSLHRSGKIKTNVLKLCQLFTVEVWQRWKHLQSSAAETIANFLLSGSFLMCTLGHYSCTRKSSWFWNRDAWKHNVTKKCSYDNLQLYNTSAEVSVVALVRSCGTTELHKAANLSKTTVLLSSIVLEGYSNNWN